MSNGKDSGMKLSEECSLVKLSMGMFGQRKTRKDLSDGTAQQHQADPKKFKTTIDAMGSEEVKELKNIQVRARNEFNDLSLAWDVYRIAKNLKTDELEKIASDCKIDCEQQVEKVCDKLPAWIEEQRIALGSAFREEDYPTADEIRSKVYVEYDIKLVPDPEHDPRAGITAAQRERFRSLVATQEKEKFAHSLESLGSIMTETIGGFKEAMDGYTGQKKGSFRDVTVTKVDALLKKVKDLNIGNDPLVESVRQQILKDLAHMNPETLRVDEKIRKDASKKADDILDRIGHFGQMAPPATDNY